MEEYTLKQVPFKREQIEICRNCKGKGRVMEIDDDDSCDFGHEKACPVCGGCGRVKKITEGTIKIEPYII